MYLNDICTHRLNELLEAKRMRSKRRFRKILIYNGSRLKEKTSEEKPISITSNINKEVPKLVINTPPEPINTSNKENINKNISFSCDTPVLPPVVPTPQFNKEISFHNANTQKPIIPLLHSNSIQSEMNQTTISFNTNINPLQTINNISNSLQCTFIDDSSILELKVFASKYEAMYPIWIDKDKEITIEINAYKC